MNGVKIAVVFVCWSLALRLEAQIPTEAEQPLPPTIPLWLGETRFANLIWKSQPRPIIHPVLGPGGVIMNRRWPLEDSADEEHDHPHHRGLWFAHGDVDGIDFWGEGDSKGRVVIVKWESKEETAGSTTLRLDCHWLDANQRLVATDRRVLRCSRLDSAQALDFELELRPAQETLRLGDTKEGTMAFRLAAPLATRGRGATGTLVNSEGASNDEVWGKRARWIDASGTIQEKKLGVAIFDHPKNLRHPTTWHARTYGLLTANPFGLSEFEKKPKGTGDYIVRSDSPLRLSYRFVFHEGDASSAKLNELWKNWAMPGPKEDSK